MEDEKSMSDLKNKVEEFCKENSGFIFENGQIKVSPDANFTHIEILYYSKLNKYLAIN